MSYLLDKKTRRKRFYYILSFAIVLSILFYFGLSVFHGLSLFSHTALRPVLVFGNTIGDKFGKVSSYFISKNSLYLQNKNLQAKIALDSARVSNYDSVLNENIGLKEILGRKNENISMTLAAILSKPNRSPYDTLTVDIGAKNGVKEDDEVFALGNVPIGRIAEVFANSSKVILFSNPEEKTQVIVDAKLVRPDDTGNSKKSIFTEVIGRGGGNFEMTIPKNIALEKGDQAVLPGITPNVLGIVETIIYDPRDPFVKALLVSPVNIQELKFVEVELQK